MGPIPSSPRKRYFWSGFVRDLGSWSIVIIIICNELVHVHCGRRSDCRHRTHTSQRPPERSRQWPARERYRRHRSATAKQLRVVGEVGSDMLPPNSRTKVTGLACMKLSVDESARWNTGSSATPLLGSAVERNIWYSALVYLPWVWGRTVSQRCETVRRS
jgi:hypothetical protein